MATERSPERPQRRAAGEAFILAGGRSSRMGRDKARVRLRGRTLLAWAKAAARDAGLPVRVIRRDVVPAGGPVGGVVTALRRTRAATVVLLACDQPFVPAAWLRRLAGAARRGPAFTADAGGRVGFPMAVPAGAGPAVEAFWEEGGRSLQELAGRLQARRLRPPRRQAAALRNLNTPAQLAEARAGHAAGSSGLG